VICGAITIGGVVFGGLAILVGSGFGSTVARECTSFFDLEQESILREINKMIET